MNVRNPWSGQSAMVVDGNTNMTVVPSTSATTFMLPTRAGHWYAIVPAGQGTLPVVNVTGMPATSAKTLGAVHIGL
jgi:hypothetical protein